jgi:hypothetical protein
VAGPLQWNIVRWSARAKFTDGSAGPLFAPVVPYRPIVRQATAADRSRFRGSVRVPHYTWGSPAPFGLPPCGALLVRSPRRLRPGRTWQPAGLAAAAAPPPVQTGTLYWNIIARPRRIARFTVGIAGGPPAATTMTASYAGFANLRPTYRPVPASYCSDLYG